MIVRDGWRLVVRFYPHTRTHLHTTRAHKVIIKNESLAAIRFGTHFYSFADVLQNRCS